MSLVKQLQRNGNSMSLILTRDMCSHLGIVENRVQVILKEDGTILLRKPMSTDEAENVAFKKLAPAFNAIASKVQD